MTFWQIFGIIIIILVILLFIVMIFAVCQVAGKASRLEDEEQIKALEEYRQKKNKKY